MVCKLSVTVAPVCGAHWLFPWKSCRYLPAFMSKCVGLKIDLSLECGAHVLSRPRFLSTGSALGAPDPKSQQYYKTNCVQMSETSIIIDSNSKLFTPRGHFELLAAVLRCIQNLLQNHSKNQKCVQTPLYFADCL